MNRDLVFIPMLLQISLTLFMFIRLGTVKSKAARLFEVDEKRRALHQDAWPDYVLKVSNNISNQFETPVLFYVLSLIAWANSNVGWLFLALAYTFVATRFIHAHVHVGKNVVALRRKVFSAGVLLLILMTALNCIVVLGG